MEDRARRKRHFRALHSLGSNEYSFRRSCTLFGAASRHQRWTIRFCLRTPSRFRASGETLRSTRKWEEEQFSAARSKIPQIKGCLERAGPSYGRQVMAHEEADRKILQSI